MIRTREPMLSYSRRRRHHPPKVQIRSRLRRPQSLPTLSTLSTGIPITPGLCMHPGGRFGTGGCPLDERGRSVHLPMYRPRLTEAYGISFRVWRLGLDVLFSQVTE